jgi:hypothetical protein
VSEHIGNFCDQLRTKLDAADKRLKDMQMGLRGAGDKAKNDAKAHLASLENKVKQQKATVQAQESSMKAWLQEKKTITNDKVAEWKAQRQVKKLASRADSAETYAAFVIQIAIAAIDEAESAVVDALIARADADATPAPAAKSA